MNANIDQLRRRHFLGRLGAFGIGATGIGATGVGATGVGATGVGATGVGATGVGATGVGATGVGAILPGCSALAPVPTKPHRIDIHHHLLPPAYMAAIATRRTGPVPAWSASRSLDEMDRNGIATSVLSIVQPGPWLGDNDEGRRLARIINDFGAQTVRDHPGRFGLFATLPFPDIQGSLREIDYALGTLKADGIGLMTSYLDRWLGDASFWPLLDELNRRRAVIYTHPNNPNCCNGLPTGVHPSTIEWATDTTRTIASIVFSGAAARFPEIKWIFSHGGGTMPFLYGRFTTFEKNMMKDREAKLPNGVVHELKKFYYDTAQANHPGALAALTRLIPASQVMFGTDYPLRPATEEVDGLRDFQFSAGDLRQIERDNALRLMPGLRTL